MVMEKLAGLSLILIYVHKLHFARKARLMQPNRAQMDNGLPVLGLALKIIV